MARYLEIRLSDQRIGWLIQESGRTGVRFDPLWKQHPDRRCFSLSVEETGLSDIRATPHLPAWFENITPEGELRRWIEASEPKLSTDSFSFLERVGGDLLGAVTLHPTSAQQAELPPGPSPLPLARAVGGKLRWSLAGVQLKLNLVDRGGRFTMPVHGELGHFIAKFPDARYADVPQNEFATLQWAKAAGIHVVESRLISAADIDELPFTIQHRDEPVLLVRRYDRDSGHRIHAEEFAQALSIRPRDKYGGRGWRAHLMLLQRVAPEDIAEYLRRFLFVIASANTDAHHKNWSFIYPDGNKPCLSPAYDQLNTMLWMDGIAVLEDSLPFKIGRSSRWRDITSAAVQRLVRRAGITHFTDAGCIIEVGADLEQWMQRSTERIQDTLCAAEALAPPRYGASLKRHWSRVPLLRPTS